LLLYRFFTNNQFNWFFPSNNSGINGITSVGLTSLTFSHHSAIIPDSIINDISPVTGLYEGSRTFEYFSTSFDKSYNLTGT